MDEKKLNLKLEKIDRDLQLLKSKVDINTSKVELIDAKLRSQKSELELKLANEINHIWKELLNESVFIQTMLDKMVEIQKENLPLEIGEIEKEKTIH